MLTPGTFPLPTPSYPTFTTQRFQCACLAWVYLGIFFCFQTVKPAALCNPRALPRSLPLSPAERWPPLCFVRFPFRRSQMPTVLSDSIIAFGRLLQKLEGGPGSLGAVSLGGSTAKLQEAGAWLEGIKVVPPPRGARHRSISSPSKANGAPWKLCRFVRVALLGAPPPGPATCSSAQVYGVRVPKSCLGQNLFSRCIHFGGGLGYPILPPSLVHYQETILGALRQKMGLSLNASASVAGSQFKW